MIQEWLILSYIGFIYRLFVSLFINLIVDYSNFLSYNNIMLKFENVTKYYHSYRAINFLDYNFNSNRIAIYGENGSGKSTFLRLCSGMEDVTAGKILLNDNPIEISKNTYFTFREGGLINKTVKENLFYPLKIRNEDNIENRVEKLLVEFDLKQVENTKLKLLPFEERARLILAKIKLRKTDILLIDNPFESLDKHTRNDYFNWFLDLIKDYEGLVIYSTDIKKELQFFNEIVLLNYGFVKGVGQYDEVFSNPFNIFTYSFFEELKLFNGRIYMDNEDMYFKEKEQKIKLSNVVSSRIIKQFIPMDCVLAVKESVVKKLGKNMQSIELTDLENYEDIWLFDWNENSIIK